VQPDDPELLRGDETRPDRAALEALRQPAGIRRVPLRPAGQVLDLPGVGEDAVEALGISGDSSRSLMMAARSAAATALPSISVVPSWTVTTWS
jgi:hypothetical protein